MMTRSRTTTVARVIPPRRDAVYGAQSAMCGILAVLCSSDRATDRQLARELALSDGEPIHVLEQGGSVRWPSIRDHAQRVGFSAEQTLQIINAAPKLYW